MPTCPIYSDLRKQVSVQIVGDLELARSVNSAVIPSVDEVDVDSSEADDQDGAVVKKVR